LRSNVNAKQIQRHGNKTFRVQLERTAEKKKNDDSKCYGDVTFRNESLTMLRQQITVQRASGASPVTVAGAEKIRLVKAMKSFTVTVGDVESTGHHRKMTSVRDLERSQDR